MIFFPFLYKHSTSINKYNVYLIRFTNTEIKEKYYCRGTKEKEKYEKKHFKVNDDGQEQ